MQNLLFILLLVLVFLSCTNQPTSESETAPVAAADTTAADSMALPSPSSPSASQAIAASDPADYLTAVGNEPGWILKMKKASDGSFPTVLVYSYGADTLTGSFPDPSPLPEGKTIAVNQRFFAAKLNLRGKAVPVEVLVTKEKCLDDAGMERQVQVKLTVEGSWHPGCGSYSER